MSREIHRVNFRSNIRGTRGTRRTRHVWPPGGRARAYTLGTPFEIVLTFTTQWTRWTLAADNRRLRADQYSFLRFREDFEVSQVRSCIGQASSYFFFFFFIFTGKEAESWRARDQFNTFVIEAREFPTSREPFTARFVSVVSSWNYSNIHYGRTSLRIWCALYKIVLNFINSVITTSVMTSVKFEINLIIDAAKIYLIKDPCNDLSSWVY